MGAMERYIFGTSVQTVTDVEPHAGLVDHTPPEYSTYAYPVGKRWERTYPAPATPLTEYAGKTPPPSYTKLWKAPPSVYKGSMDGLMLLLPPPLLRVADAGRYPRSTEGQGDGSCSRRHRNKDSLPPVRCSQCTTATTFL